MIKPWSELSAEEKEKRLKETALHNSIVQKNAAYRAIARAEAERDKSDPFVYGRTMARLKNGTFD